MVTDVEKTHDESQIEMGKGGGDVLPGHAEEDEVPVVTPKTWFVVAVSAFGLIFYLEVTDNRFSH